MDYLLFQQKRIALLKAVAIVGSQAKLARLLKINPDRLNHWINTDMQIPFEYIEQIEALTEGRVTREQLGPHIDWKRYPRRSNFSPKADNSTVAIALVRLVCQPKSSNPQAPSALTQSIANEGLNQPILIDITGHVIDGYQRVLAYEQLNKKHIPCQVIDVNQLLKHGKLIVGLINLLTLRAQATLCVHLKSLLSQRHGRKGLHKVEDFQPYLGKKSREVIATVMGYGNVKVPEQLEKVLVLGMPELFPAIEAKHIALSNAVLLARLPKRWQETLLAWPKATIIRFCQHRRLRQKLHLRQLSPKVGQPSQAQLQTQSQLQTQAQPQVQSQAQPQAVSTPQRYQNPLTFNLTLGETTDA